MGAREHASMGAREHRDSGALRRRGTRASRRAFTLVEFLIVVLIVSTIAATALPALSAAMESMKASALAREIATDLRYAQMLAVKTGVRHRVSFWTEGQAYAVRYENGSSWDLCTHPITKKDWQRQLDQHSRYGGLTLIAAKFGSGEYLYWDTLGSPEAGGYVTFTLGKSTRTLWVEPLSGRVRVETTAPPDD